MMMDNANRQQTQGQGWMTNMRMKKNGKQQHLSLFVVVVYSGRKDRPSPVTFLTPIPVAMLLMVTFGNWTTNDNRFIVCHHSLFILLYILYILCI